MILDMNVECVPGRGTGDARYYDRSNGALVYEMQAGVVTYTNPTYFLIADSCASNAPAPEAKPEPKKPQEPFYLRFQKQRKKDYLAQK